MFKIIHNKEKCIGCGKCVKISENWRLGRYKAEPKVTEVETLGTNKIVSLLCPVQCIKIEKI